MNKQISFQKLGIAGLTAIGMSAGLVAGIAPAAGVHAADPLTFTATIHQQDAKGGNVEFEWKVEEGVVEGGDDINIGVGELQECTISKSMDSATPKLAQFAINGNTPAADQRLRNFEIQVLTSDLQTADGAKGGNVEFEWKVEEGES